MLLALCLLAEVWYLVLGAGFVLDDWYFLRNATLDGAIHVAGPSGGDRPVGAAIWALVFGGIGHHPAPILLLMGVGNGVSAILFARLVSSFLPARLAFAAAAAWAVLPTHSALEAWMSTSVAVFAQAAVLGALVLVSVERPSRLRLAGAATLCLLAVLSYESSALVAVGGVVTLRWARLRRLDPAPLLAVGAGTAAGLAWAATHWRGRTSTGHVANPLRVLPANFGWGLAPGEPLATLTLVAAVVGLVLVARHHLLTRAAAVHPGTAAVAVGVVVLFAGTLPFLTYFYAPLGAGDRLNWMSAFGAALVLAGFLEHLWDHSRQVAAAAGAAVVLVALAGRAERTAYWATAGRDGWRVAQAVVAAHPDPDRPLLIGPERIQVDNIAAFFDASNVEGAVQLAYRSRVPVLLSYSVAQYEAAADVIRFDQRPFSRLDDRR